MKKIICYALIAYLGMFSSFAQKTTPLDSTYTNYFTYARIIPYLHLNKTSFIKGEEIWFKSYVLNQQNNKLDTTTTNLYCIIYDAHGKQKEKKLIKVKNGIANGSFKIDSTFTDKSYYIKATTNWMKNFKEDHSYVQKINIVTNNNDPLVQEKTPAYTIDLLPEGGHLLEESDNSLGIVIKTPNRKGIKIKSGVLLNQHNKIVKEFKTSLFGHGKVDFYFNKENRYRVKIELHDGTLLTEALPKPKKLGIALKVVNTNTPFIQISLNTNPQTLATSNQKKFTLLIHNTRNYYKKTIQFNSKNTAYTYYIPTTKIKKGVNIITLFNSDNTPIAERVIFNYKKSTIAALDISKRTIHSDSIGIVVKKENPTTHFISASVLPNDSKSNLNKSSILFNFLLKPYIRGTIENPNYFFKKTTRQKLMELDLLLLTQGWSKYDWKNIFNPQHRIQHKIEQGITIKGTINTAVKSSNITLISKSNSIFTMQPIVNNTFKIDNLFLEHDSQFELAYNQKNKLQKGKAYLQFFPNNFTSILRLKKTNNQHAPHSHNVKYKDFIKDSELLKEVDIKGIKKEQNDIDLLHQGAFMNSYNMQNRLNNHNETIWEFLREKGFNVNTNQSQITINATSLSFSSSSTPENIPSSSSASIENTSNSNSNSNSTPTPVAPSPSIGIRFYLDNNEITLSLEYLESMYTDEFSKIYIDRFDRYGKTSIHLFSKPLDFSNNKTNKFTTTKVPFGFHVPKEYYTPKYTSHTNKLFRDYAAIYWIPNITLTNSSTPLKIPLLNQKEVKILLEGITSDGAIIYEEKTLNTRKDRPSKNLKTMLKK